MLKKYLMTWLCVLSVFFSPGFVFARTVLPEWTGSPGTGMYSNVKIGDVHTGMINDDAYFCVKAVRSDFSAIACAVQNESVWAPNFDMLYNQAMYFYSTGENVRLYFKPDVWSRQDFISALSTNAITGFSTCNSAMSEHNVCFGPDKAGRN
ncbi:subtilase cytotoxin subunit B [Cronobacter sp. EKM101R]|uniref:subtilase family AB5 toxin binding subunit n=1 Tax=Cronobacter TaxID=413496 RepID=UPI0013EA8D6D|nr:MULTISPECIES: subtilase family AB5 toxin binding subunit [Cronobacter]KAF6589096.1 subtilase cytotoxin subunit B [Cronobacter sp. EKM101R]KAF6592386.1 subtilase cytotoxin subunit B [Cronobacter sp. EKM102R]MDK1236482.1 subtilase family AB5 toxin binding subunit [Cronobacter turicensis]HDI3023914.1 subtilase cytotoxin subunit B [Cronobacter turicensis]